MRYEYNETVSSEQIGRLRESVGWPGMKSDYEHPRFQSFYHIACYLEDELVGYIDTVSNGVTDAYIQDLMVSPKYQSRGIGTALMNSCIRYLKEQGIFMASIVYGGPELRSYYEKFGFFTMFCGQMELRNPL